MAQRRSKGPFQIADLRPENVHEVNEAFRQLQDEIDEIRGETSKPFVTLAPHSHEYLGGVVSGTIITPPTITVNQNNYEPIGWNEALMVRLSSSPARSITGFKSDSSGEFKLLHNVGSTNITLVNGSTSSSWDNRLALVANITLTPNGAVLIQYDATSRRWRAVGASSSAGDHGNLAGLADDDHTQYVKVTSRDETIDLSARTAGSPVFKITATSDTPAVTFGAAAGNEVSAVPAGYLEILVGATPCYIPYWT